VTPPGGSRDDDIAPRGEPAPGPGRSGAPGSSPGDAPGDARDREPGSDRQLRAMRAVWVEMRDEDPPDHGLAALLAAARHQAEAMQPRPTAWQRLLAALRRPPVLALATATVLIAGAVLIGRRIPREPAPALSASQDEGAGPPLSTPLDHTTHRTRQAMERGDALAVPAPQPAAPPPAAPPPERDRLPPAPPAQHTWTRTSTASASAPPGEARRKDDDRAAAGPAPEAPPPPADPAPPPSSSETATPLGASAALPGDGSSHGNSGRNVARPPRAEPPTQPSGGASSDTANGALNNTANNATNNTANSARNNTANNAANNAASPVANAVAPKRRPPPAPPRPDAAGDPYRQCEAAAGRGDCATVRRLVDQITRTDPSYRDRVAKDSPVGKCLAE
jgi:hypothetical protein